jgi:glyoxylase-like metal-dependent hydrolase (beta-lactamase superfamily II)
MATPVTLSEDQLAVNQLQVRGIRPQDITRIFISHFHADHTAALGDFPNARFTYFPAAYDAVSAKTGLNALSKAFIPGLIPPSFLERSTPINPNQSVPLPPEFAPFERGFDLLGDGSVLAVDLPGHAWGQMGLLVRAQSDVIYFFVADAAWLFRAIQTDRPPHPITNLFFSQPGPYAATLHHLYLLHHNRPDIHFIPSHCAETLATYQPVAGL